MQKDVTWNSDSSSQRELTNSLKVVAISSGIILGFFKFYLVLLGSSSKGFIEWERSRYVLFASPGLDFIGGL